jgi:hypothetical protein
MMGGEVERWAMGGRRMQTGALGRSFAQLTTESGVPGNIQCKSGEVAMHLRQLGGEAALVVCLAMSMEDGRKGHGARVPHPTAAAHVAQHQGRCRRQRRILGGVIVDSIAAVAQRARVAYDGRLLAPTCMSSVRGRGESGQPMSPEAIPAVKVQPCHPC